MTSPVTIVLSAHNLTVEQAIAENVAFVCADCKSITCVTPTRTSTRENQRDMLALHMDMSCCGQPMLLV